jgi:site-specific recombinase XerD
MAEVIQSDLKRAGIPYKTNEGIADFHAAGRHTYITQLIRSGASLPEAKELARHSEIKMTLRYTHIGIVDQAKALANLPTAPTALHFGWRRMS